MYSKETFPSRQDFILVVKYRNDCEQRVFYVDTYSKDVALSHT
jgi:hypothetical protein